MGEGRIMQEQLSRVTHGAVTEDARAEEQLTTFNSVTSRHAEPCILKWFGYMHDFKINYFLFQPTFLDKSAECCKMK